MKRCLAIAGSQYDELTHLLLAEKGIESAAVLLCNHGVTDEMTLLLVKDVIKISESAYMVRKENYVSYSWKHVLTPELIKKIDVENFSLFTVHSHPSGLKSFSSIDDENDSLFFRSLYNLTDDTRHHGSAIITPDGEIIARNIDESGMFNDMEVRVVGDKLIYYKRPIIDEKVKLQRSSKRFIQAFGKGTFDILRSLKAGVVGCSGTGSLTIEFLARNCVGSLFVCDDERVEAVNLNRMVGSKSSDARKHMYKVVVMKEYVESLGMGTSVACMSSTTADQAVIDELKTCDVIFGCVDSVEGRYHLECLSTAYYIPYFDVGVRIISDSNGNLELSTAVAIYTSPDNSGVLANNAYTLKQVEAEGWRRKRPEYYAEQVKESYLTMVNEEQPAVISVNSMAVTMSINDFLARIHGFRIDGNDRFNIQRMDIVKGSYLNSAGENTKAQPFLDAVGLGDKSLLLDYV